MSTPIGNNMVFNLESTLIKNISAQIRAQLKVPKTDQPGSSTDA